MGLRHRKQLPFGGSFGQAVLGLDADQRSEAAQVGTSSRPSHPPSREVGQPAVEDLASADEVVEAREDLSDGSGPVGEVRHEDVDVVGVQPAQALLQGSDHGLAAVAGSSRAWPDLPGAAVLGDDHELVALPAEQSAEDGLRFPALIDVRDVERRAPGGDVPLEDLTRSLQAGAGVGRPEVRRAQDVLGHPEAGLSSKDFVAHEEAPCSSQR